MAKDQMIRERFAHLYHKWCSQQLTDAEWEEFKLAVMNPATQEMLSSAVGQDLLLPDLDNILSDAERNDVLGRMRQLLDVSPKQIDTSLHSVPFYKSAWFRAAAIIIIIFGLGSLFWLRDPDNTSPIVRKADQPVQTDIAAGGERATLTLADGRIIALDSVANGQLSNQGGVNVVKLSSGQLAYDQHDEKSIKVFSNTLRTPKGGQYQITLPDGTKVWLNASSSIVFPTAFTGATREVRIEGEIYFEVAKNKQKPFIVDVDGKVAIQVLGTRFNINSYADEESIKTALIEGSVKVTKDGQNILLKPGYQAIIDSSAQHPALTENEIQIRRADLDQVLAWKNGIFNFDGADLKTVMRQLERWYDIKVEYKGPVSSELFKGKMYRNVNLSVVLEMLKKMDVQFELKGKNLIVF